MISNVHDTPKLTSCEPDDICRFVEKVKALHASGVDCKIDQWIVNHKDKEALAIFLLGNQIISDPSELGPILDDTATFIEKMEQFLIARGCDAGDVTLNRKVHNHLKLTYWI